MGILDRIRGIKKPKPGVAPLSAHEVRLAIIGIDRVSSPFTIREGTAEGVDLVAEWRIVDAAWYEIFAKAGLTKVFKVLMKLDPDKHEVRSVDEEWSVEWRVGVPNLSQVAQKFRGQKTEVEFGQAYAFTEELRPGQVYNYKFRTSEIKGPLQEAVIGSGWTWRGVSFGKL